MSYILPQVEVFQVFTQAPQSVVKNLNAFVFGPHYQLFRYGVAAEKAYIGLGAYDAEVTTAYAYPTQPSGSVVDTRYTKLYLENVKAQYAVIPADAAYQARVTSERNKIRVENVVLKTTPGYLRSGLLKSRDVKVGDTIRYSHGYFNGLSTVVGLEADYTPAAVGELAVGAGSVWTTGELTKGGSFTGPKNTTYTLVVTRAGVTDRTVDVTNDGYNGAADTDVVADISGWLAGNTDDVYRLVCTHAGTLSAARFDLTSLNADNASNLAFSTGVAKFVGAHGLKLTLTQGVDDFSLNDTWTVTVNALRASVKVTDSAGIDSSSVLTIDKNAPMRVGSFGATVAIDLATLTLGDTATLPCTVAVAEAVKTMVLADEVVAGIDTSTDIEVQLFLGQTGVSIPWKRVDTDGDYNWKDVAGQFEVYAGMTVQDASVYTGSVGDPTFVDLPVYSADMFVEYRALMTEYADTIHSLADVSSVPTTLGTVHPDNPLAQGVSNALTNSGNRAVYFMAVPTDDANGFSAVLNRATLSGDVYAFAPLTSNRAILDTVTGHIMAQSTETAKRWRIGFYGATMPTTKAVYHLASNPSTVEFYATVTNYSGSNVLVRFVTETGDPNPYTRCLADVKAGDKVLIGFVTDPWVIPTNDTYEVKAVLTNSTLLLTSGPDTPIAVPSKVEVWHPYTLDESAEAVAAESTGYFNRRIYNVFPSQLTSAGVTMSGEFGAAAVAGLCSSVAPQQGLTNIQLLGFDDLPLVYGTFNRTQLDKMAAGGTLIIMQDVVGGEVYIRHQVSTQASEGNLNVTELSITKNLDSMSYYFASILSPYIGRYNVTAELLGAIKTTIYDGLSFLGSFTSIGLLGPQLDLENTNIAVLQQHPVLKDTIICTINMGMPAPFNVMQLSLVV